MHHERALADELLVAAGVMKTAIALPADSSVSEPTIRRRPSP